MKAASHVRAQGGPPTPAGVADFAAERHQRDAAERAADALHAFRCGAAPFTAVLRSLIAPFDRSAADDQAL